MSARTIGRLRHVRNGPTNHTVSFSLEYGLTKAWITLEVGDSLHEPDLSAVYRAMLFRLGQVAQEAAASPHLLFADGELGRSAVVRRRPEEVADELEAPPKPSDKTHYTKACVGGSAP